MANKITDTNNYSAIANSIRSKLNTQSTYTPSQMAAAIDSIPVTDIEALSVTDNGTYTAPTGTAYNPVTVNVSGGSSSAELNDVNFYDYDGTIVDSYSASDFLALTSMPENPSHTGLTAQGWNWSLADAKEYVTDYGKLNVGQMYITDDGKTRIYVHMQEGRLHPYLGICPNGTVEVDWGDGSATSRLSGTSLTTVRTADHVYASGGDYVITLNVVSGSFQFYGTNSSAYIFRRSTDASSNENVVYLNCVRKIEVGQGTRIGQYAFRNCYRLESITIPSSDIREIGQNAFFNCYNLKSITMSNSITTIGSGAFRSNANLASISMPSSITNIGSNAFANNNALAKVTIPNGVTAIGASAFSGCYGLEDVTIPIITDLGSNMVSGCYSLTNITIPNGIRSIGSSTFSNCQGLAIITIPSSVVSIASEAFGNCYGVSEYHLLPTKPPTIQSATFSNIPSDCIIYVPSESLEAYQTATYWSSYASKMVGE